MPNRVARANYRCDVLYVGEQTTHVVRLIRGVADRGLRPAVLNGARLVSTLADEESLEIPHFACPAVRLRGRYRFEWLKSVEKRLHSARLRRLLARIRPRVIHINGVSADQEVFTALRAACPPVVLTCWGTDINAGLAHGPPARRRAITRVLQLARVITADSDEMIERVQAATGWSCADLRRVLWGIEAGRFTAEDPAACAAWRRELDIPGDSAVVLAPRRIDPRYHPQRVLRAFARSRSARRAHLVFKLLGDNPVREQRQQRVLEELAVELDVARRIRFARPCRYDELPGLYRLADCALFLLSRDGCPSTAFELMAAGVPVIAGDITGYTGLLEHRGNALLVDPQDTAGAARLLDEVIEQPALQQERIDGALEWVARNASLGAMIDAFIDAYRAAGSSGEAWGPEHPIKERGIGHEPHVMEAITSGESRSSRA